MVVVEVLAGPEFRTGPEQVLFASNAFRRDYFHAAYDVTADGQRFVMIRASETVRLEEELIVVEQWFEELNRVSPTN